MKRFTQLLTVATLCITLILIFSGAAFSAIYYIDYVGGSDSNNGTTKSTPWKRQPYMAGFSGTYTHAAGDQFIFKGGVTWPNACFRMNISKGGNSENTRDYYGVDSSWFTGASWSRPVFDLQSQQTATYNHVINIASGVSYVTIDNIEIVNFYWTGAQSYGNCVILNNYYGTYITFKNLYIHSWTHGTYAAGTRDDMKVYIGATTSPFNPGCIVEYCTIDGGPSGTDSGMATYGGLPTARFNTVRNMSNGILTSGVSGSHAVYNNTIYNINQSFDSAQHENGIETFGPAEIYNNLIYNVQRGVVILTGPTIYTPGYDYIYNNVIYGNAAIIPLQIDEDYSPTNAGAYIYNNTIQTSGNVSCIRFVDRGKGAFNAATIQNNHFITETSIPIGVASTGNAYVTNYVADHNLLQNNITATGQGYVKGNNYAPTLASNSTVNLGVSQSGSFVTDILGMSRPQGPVWDIGAYQYRLTTALPAPRSLSIP